MAGKFIIRFEMRSYDLFRVAQSSCNTSDIKYFHTRYMFSCSRNIVVFDDVPLIFRSCSLYGFLMSVCITIASILQQF